MKKPIAVLILTVFLAATCSSAFAEEKKIETQPWKKFDISLGAFVFNTDSSVRLGVPGAGLSINVEDALAMETESTVLRLEGTWRFSDNMRHQAELSWFAMRRNGYKTLTEDLIVDGVKYPIGTQVATDFDLDIYKAAYGYSFFHDDRVDIAATLGLYVMPIKFDLKASGALTAQADANFTAPLPVFGLRAAFALTPKWILKSDVDAFYLEYENFKGAIFDTTVALEYNAFKNIGFGLGIENFHLEVEAEGEDYPEVDLFGSLEMQYLGAMLYVKFFF